MDKNQLKNLLIFSRFPPNLNTSKCPLINQSTILSISITILNTVAVNKCPLIDFLGVSLSKNDTITAWNLKNN